MLLLVVVHFLSIHHEVAVLVEGKKQLPHHVNVSTLFARNKSTLLTSLLHNDDGVDYPSTSNALKIGIYTDMNSIRIRGGSSVGSGGTTSSGTTSISNSSTSNDSNNKPKDVLEKDEMESIEVLSSSSSTSQTEERDADGIMEAEEERETIYQQDEGDDEEELEEVEDEGVKDDDRVEEGEILFQEEEGGVNVEQYGEEEEIMIDDMDSGVIYNQEEIEMNMMQKENEEDLEEYDINEEEGEMINSATLMGYEINDNTVEEEEDLEENDDYHDQNITQENDTGASADFDMSMSMSMNDDSDVNVVVDDDDDDDDDDIADDGDDIIHQDEDEIDFEDEYPDDGKTNYNENLMDDHDEEDGGIGIIIDDIDTGSDSAAFVDRMDLADAYDDGIFTDFMGEDDTSMTATPAATPTIPTSTSTTAAIDTDLDNDDDTSLSVSSSANTMPLPDVIQPDNRPTVQYIITANMRRCLIRQLGYSPQEVRHMKPDVAAVVVSKMLKRPQLGMPKEFYIDGTAPAIMTAKPKGIWGIRTKCIVREIILPTLVTGASLYYGAAFVVKSKQNSDNDGNDDDYDKNSIAVTSSKDNQPMSGYEAESKKDIHDSITSRDDVNPVVTDAGRGIIPPTLGKATGATGNEKENNDSLVEDNPEGDNPEGDNPVGDNPEGDNPEDSELLDAMVEDSRKSFFDSVVTYALEKIDELTKRPF